MSKKVKRPVSGKTTAAHVKRVYETQAKANQRDEARKMLKRSLREEKEIARLGKQVKAAIQKADETVSDLAVFIAETAIAAGAASRGSSGADVLPIGADRPDYQDGIGKWRCGRCLHEIDPPLAIDAEGREVETV
jgi:hypothetical protein